MTPITTHDSRRVRVAILLTLLVLASWTIVQTAAKAATTQECVPEDTSMQMSGRPSGKRVPKKDCGNGTCETGEDNSTCPADCLNYSGPCDGYCGVLDLLPIYHPSSCPSDCW